MSTFFSQLFKLLLILASPFVLFALALISCIVYYFFYEYFVNEKRLKLSSSIYKEESFFKKLFVLFPKRFIKDLYESDPNEFKEFGFVLYTGFQGSGKTISVTKALLDYKKKYPKIKIRTNMGYAFEDGVINSGDDLLNNTNGVFGQIEVIDEIQSWYSSLQSRDFPPYLIEEVCQQRKQRKMIIGTAQVYSRVAKPLREVCSKVVVCKTFFGCITVCRVSRPCYWNEEKQEFIKYLYSYWYVHDDLVRNSYDTYKKIRQMKKSGYKKMNPLEKENDLKVDLKVSPVIGKP